MTEEIQTIIADIEIYFPFLFEKGFKIVRAEYYEQNFGNWLVVLNSEKSCIRLLQDRSYVSCSIGPSCVVGGGGIDYALDVVIAFLTEGKARSQKLGIIKPYQEQFQEIAVNIENYIERINQLFQKDFAEYGDELDSLARKMWF